MASLLLKKKRVSKKKKASWRKHVNITDVEEFLEDQCLEQRLGPPLSTLPDDLLFQIDTGSEKPNAKSRKDRLNKPLKCFAILSPHTGVPDPISKRNRVRAKEERKNILVKKKEKENLNNGVLKARERQSLQDRKLYELKKKNQPKRGQFLTDIWGADEKDQIENDEWAIPNTIKHNLCGTGKIRKTIRIVPVRKCAPLPKVEPPHPGISYNPSYEDHQNLLKEIAEKELKLIKNEEHLDRVTRKMFNRVSIDTKDSSWLMEMSEGLEKSDETIIENNEETDNEYKSVNPPVKNKKKTLKQRRKQIEQQKLECERKQVKLEKRKVTDIHKLKILNRKLEKQDEKMRLLQGKRLKSKKIKETQTKQLGPIKFEDVDLEFNLGDEISGNLRNLKKEGNILVDRFKSLQKRNIIAPSVRHYIKKSKVKIYTKPDHKDDWKKTVAR